jgi:anti-sigma regulatory factor (Ser/Thr protein kinase)/anti-anti-sigma regulatory factor
MASRILTSGNRVQVVGSFALSDLRRLIAALHNQTTRLGHQSIVLDFSQSAAVYPSAMVALCAQVVELRRRGIDFELVLPTDYRLARLFANSNWSHLIDPNRQGRSAYRGYTNMPLALFASPEDQSATVSRLIDALLCSIPSLDRSDFAAIEWCLSEITDNVLVHAQSQVGGFVQMTSFKQRRRVEFSVADAGISIPTSLREGHPELGEDIRALERAVREGVTRNPDLGQGNGLFGTFQVTRTSGGYLHIHSGYARLDYEDDQLRFTKEDVPFRGTLVVACLDCSNPAALGDALRFRDAKHTPLDYIETHFEDRSSDHLVFHLSQEATSFGSRLAGEPVRTKLHNLVHMNPGRRLVVDMADVPLVSSSFADEVFGKLFVSLGPLLFTQALEFRQISQTVRSLVDKAILQRMSRGSGT